VSGSTRPRRVVIPLAGILAAMQIVEAGDAETNVSPASFLLSPVKFYLPAR